MNIWVGDGRLTKDIELKTSQTGMEYCKFSIAVDRRAKKGEEKESDFVTITAFGKTAAFIAQYFHKGDEIKVSIRCSPRSGRTRTETAVSIGTSWQRMSSSGGRRANAPDRTVPIRTA